MTGQGLKSETNLLDGDGFYAELLAAHKGMSLEEGAALSARLVLILANHVGDDAVLRQALMAAKTAD